MATRLNSSPLTAKTAPPLRHSWAAAGYPAPGKWSLNLIRGIVLSTLLVLSPPLPLQVQAQVTPMPPARQSDSTPTEEAYTLGPGDRVKIDIFDTPELKLEERYSVLIDGTLNLPWIGSVIVQDLTPEQAAAAISRRYSRFIKNPVITVSLTASRPLKIGIVGEVNRPGSYIISPISGEQVTGGNLPQRSGASETGSQWPTVTRAIQTAGGITQSANIRFIKVRRLDPAGAEQLVNVDLWKFLQEGDLRQDVLLRDGDTVLIPRASDLNPVEVGQVAVSNISPDTIKINVVGEVVTPGAVALPPNASLNQAILAAGGFKSGRAQSSNVELVRLNLDGTVSKQAVAVNFSQGLNDKNNPLLRNNDIVIVRPNGLARTSDFLSVVLSPLTTGFAGLLGLFRLFGGE